ncbi:hypothetical protein LK03_01835 [Pseudomonas cremoricolorata]|uniref:Uncharacterized protein n=1 Tax=Pseudomonas cremoricolorata TaxID=157783 RepID=A0A089Y876_9PSED|nr:hypothetical protein LK03_01835 [Pseudomonas cremoricolorata]
MYKKRFADVVAGSQVGFDKFTTLIVRPQPLSIMIGIDARTRFSAATAAMAQALGLLYIDHPDDTDRDCRRPERRCSKGRAR